MFGAGPVITDIAFQRAADLRAGVCRRAAIGRGSAAPYSKELRVGMI